MAPLTDPCPPVEKGPEKQVRRSLKDKEKRLYAPMSDIGDLISDNKDNIYIRIPAKKVAFSKPEDLLPVTNDDNDGEGDEEDGEGDGDDKEERRKKKRQPPVTQILQGAGPDMVRTLQDLKVTISNISMINDMP
jgi:hypothetical protein